MKHPVLKMTSIAVLAALGMTACMHDQAQNADQSQAKTGYVTSGVITGFGSVFINGVEYNTDDSAFDINDAAGTENQLKIGMYITLQGDVNADGTTGKAANISFDHDVEGMVLANNISAGVGTLDIMGQTVNVDLDTKFESDVPDILTIDGIQLNNIVEVSGYSSGNGSIYATRVELKKAAHAAGEEIEMKGVVSRLTDTNFVIGGMTVNYANAQMEDFEGVVLADGMYVKVKSTDGINANGELLASKLKLKQKEGKGEKRDEGQEMELEGLVTTTVNIDGNLVEINGQAITLNSDTEYEGGTLVDLVAGKKVEVEGEFDANGNYVASQIKFRAEAKIEMKGLLEAVDTTANTITLFGQTMSVNNMTVMDDEQDEGVEPVKYFNLTHLAVGDWLKVKAFKDDAGNLIAAKLERDDAGDLNNGVLEVELRGLIDSISDTGQLVVSGISVDVSAITGKQFTQGAEIEMKGTYADGLFTAIEVSVEESDSGNSEG